MGGIIFFLSVCAGDETGTVRLSECDYCVPIQVPRLLVAGQAV